MSTQTVLELMLREKVLTQASEEDWRDEFDFFINDIEENHDPFFVNAIHIGALAIKASGDNVKAILQEREKQKELYSEEHDDEKHYEEWFDMFDEYVNDVDRPFDRNMIIVGALALAAAESVLRKKK